jgi:hypothetical protein
MFLAREYLLYCVRMMVWRTKYVILQVTIWFLCLVGCCCNNSTRIFGPKRYEIRGGWRKLHNKELRNLYSSPNMIRMIKSMRKR